MKNRKRLAALILSALLLASCSRAVPAAGDGDETEPAPTVTANDPGSSESGPDPAETEAKPDDPAETEAKPQEPVPASPVFRGAGSLHVQVLRNSSVKRASEAQRKGLLKQPLCPYFFSGSG